MTKQFILPNEIVKKLQGIRLTTKSKIRGHHKGSHHSRRVGSSMDFSDYRAYHVGDDVRLIDWNVYARSEKFYIKRYLDEQEMRVQIILDGTKSMMSTEEKWQFARQLAAAIGYNVLAQDDRLHLSYITDETVPPFKRKGNSAKQLMLNTIEQFPLPTLTTPFTKKAQSSLVKGNSILIVITDALEPIDQLEALISKLPHFANDVRLLQIIDTAEEEPEFIGDIEFYDIETEKLVNVTVTEAMVKRYKNTKELHEKQLKKICKKYGVAHEQGFVKEGFNHTYFSRLKKSNWIE